MKQTSSFLITSLGSPKVSLIGKLVLNKDINLVKTKPMESIGQTID